VTSTAVLLLALAVVAAATDWYAVAEDRRGVEYVAKPAVLLLLLLAALALDPASGAQRDVFVVGLAFSLAGDVLLMLPGEHWFVFGLAAFLIAHLAYIVGFWVAGVSAAPLLVGLVVVAIALVLLGLRIVRAVARGPEAALVVPVMVYVGAISLMVASAFGTAQVLAVVGALLFYASDAVLAWTRFVGSMRHGRLVIMVTYHLAQAALVLSLV
jgi:uncharacterized membrane protein YhhN